MPKHTEAEKLKNKKAREAKRKKSRAKAEKAVSKAGLFGAMKKKKKKVRKMAGGGLVEEFPLKSRTLQTPTGVTTNRRPRRSPAGGRRRRGV